MKLIRKFTVYFMIFMTLCMAFFVFSVYSSSFQMRKYRIGNDLRNNAFNMTYGLDKFLRGRSVETRLFAEDPMFFSPGSTRKMLAQKLIEFRDNSKMYVSISFVGPDFTVIADSSGMLAGERTEEQDLPFINDAVSEKNFVISLSHSVSLGKNVFSFYSPVKDDSGKTFGVLISRILASQIWEAVFRTIPEEYPTEKCLFDRNGLLLFSTHDIENLYHTKLTDYFPGIDPILKNNPENGIGILYDSYAKRWEILGYAKDPGFIDFEGNRYLLIVHIPKETAFQPVYAITHRTILFAVLFILAGTFIGRAAINMLLKPLAEMREALIKVSEGDFSPALKVSSSNNEISLLIRTFNDMLPRIKQIAPSRDELNMEIREREKAYLKLTQSEKQLKEQTEELLKVVKEEEDTRQIMLSMLEDNNQIREKLEKKVEELQAAERALVQSEKLVSLGRLVSDMAHEVNNPLMIISGRAQLSLLEEINDPKLTENLQIINDQCLRAKDVIQRLLLFSRPSVGERKELDVIKSLDLVVALMEHQYQLKNISIKKQYLSLPLICLIDEKQLHEVFMNLLKNSAEAMSESGGIITIKAFKEYGKARIDISDTGAGIPEEIMEKIFDPFFTTKEQGTGLGLSVCYGIVKAHDGELKYSSKVGKGTTATVLLPLSNEGEITS